MGKAGYSLSINNDVLCQDGLKCLSVSFLVDKGEIWGLEKSDFSVQLFIAYYYEEGRGQMDIVLQGIGLNSY